MTRTALLAGASLLAMASASEAAPVVAFVGGFANALGAGTWLASGAVGAWSAGFAVGSFFGASAIGRLALSIGLNAIVARASRPKFPPPQQQLVNLSQPLTFMQRGYGRVRKGGPVGFTAFASSSRHYAVIIAAHRTKGPVAHWLDTTQVLLDGSGNIITAPMTGHGSIRTYRGLPGQTVDALLDSTFAQVTAAYDFAGLSYAAIQCKAPAAADVTTVLPSGREWTYAPVWDMWDEIHDPRDNTEKWTDNLALIIAHEALFYGKSVDWDEVAVEADICDQLVTNGAGGTQKRWTFNGTFSDETTWEQAREALALAGNVFFYETPEGHVGFRVGRHIEPDILLTERDFIDVTFSHKAWGPDVPGECVVKYTEPAFDWQEASAGAIVAEPGLPRLDEEVWGIDSHNQACRVGKWLLTRARAERYLQGSVKMIGYDLIGKRTVRVQLATPAGFDFIFEIDKFVREAGGISFTIEAHQTSAADHAFNALTEEPQRPARTEVASDNSVPPVVGLAGSVVSGTGGVAQIEWEWPAQGASLTQTIRIRTLDGGLPNWQEIATGQGQVTLLTSALIDGKTYDAQARNRTASGRVGDWSATVSVVALANTVAPAALTAFAVAVSGGTTGAVTFTAPDDAVYRATRVWRGTTATFSAAVLVHTEPGLQGMADGWNNTALTAGTYYYWAAPINGSGIEGPLSGPQSITII
ncbi:MAG: phage tail protein [Paracoccaceae bacterium]